MQCLLAYEKLHYIINFLICFNLYIKVIKTLVTDSINLKTE